LCREYRGIREKNPFVLLVQRSPKNASLFSLSPPRERARVRGYIKKMKQRKPRPPQILSHTLCVN